MAQRSLRESLLCLQGYAAIVLAPAMQTGAFNRPAVRRFSAVFCKATAGKLVEHSACTNPSPKIKCAEMAGSMHPNGSWQTDGSKATIRRQKLATKSAAVNLF